MKKLAVFDIDGTLFRWQLYHELVFELKERDHFSEEEARALDEALISWQAKHISWRDYEMLVIHTIEDHIRDITPTDLEESARAVVDRSGHKIYGYTAKLLRELGEAGYFTLAISASQQEIVEQFAQKYGFDDCIGALYERVDNVYTGKKSRSVHGRKDELIHEYLATHPEITLEGSYAVGDSAGDTAMLELAETPIAFNPSDDLLDIAMERGWRIVIERKNVAYTLEGPDGHFVLAKTDRF
ncbi:MAG TPA: HAD family phosphatase [Patescibacteria group bacterium]|jgi:HAD superfamily hydrolase (TIGR01490 family)|nr:HAD family phosphatase [Patescibacteria group bacterium]